MIPYIEKELNTIERAYRKATWRGVEAQSLSESPLTERSEGSVRRHSPNKVRRRSPDKVGRRSPNKEMAHAKTLGTIGAAPVAVAAREPTRDLVFELERNRGLLQGRVALLRGEHPPAASQRVFGIDRTGLKEPVLGSIGVQHCLFTVVWLCDLTCRGLHYIVFMQVSTM